jgi:hypothetical protein
LFALGGLNGMTPEERERFEWLCKQVETEKDPKKFDQYVRELNDLLEAKHERIHPEHKPNELGRSTPHD